MNPLFFLHESDAAIKLTGLSADPHKTAAFVGDIRQMLRFVTDTQLTDSALWRCFVEQYRIKADGDGYTDAVLLPADGQPFPTLVP